MQFVMHSKISSMQCGKRMSLRIEYTWKGGGEGGQIEVVACHLFCVWGKHMYGVCKSFREAFNLLQLNLWHVATKSDFACALKLQLAATVSLYVCVSVCARFINTIKMLCV